MSNITASRHSKKTVLISLIIPAYKQERTVRRDLLRIKKTMDVLTKSYEIIVVVDGHLDNTFKNAKKIKGRKIKVFEYKVNKGKGYAVRFGMAKAKGEIIAFLDAGMDIHPKGVEILMTIMEGEEADIVIGSKRHPNSKVSYPWQRKIMSWGYQKIVHAYFGLSVSDTQVGMKLFRRKVLEDVLPRLLVKRYAFDIEILAVAHHLGYKKIKEAPVTLTFTSWSSITSTNFLHAIFHMMWDTTAVFYRLKILKYYDNGSRRKWRYDPDLNFRINIG